MVIRRASFIVFSVGLVVGLLALPVRAAWAGAPSEQLRSAIHKVIGAVTDRRLPRSERDTTIRKIADRIFDFREMARRALGLNWRGRSSQERTEFERLFTELLERAYISKIEAYGGERIVFAGDSTDDGYATVRTQLITRRGTEVPMDYFMLQQGSRWLIYDVSIEGISLVDNYRTQFSEIIQASSYPDLVKRLKAKLGQPGPGAGQWERSANR
jgi:phospholipid transport system substrate-binding protein